MPNKRLAFVFGCMAFMAGLHISSSCPGIQNEYGTMPLDSDVKVGESHSLNCTLFSHTVNFRNRDYSVNCSNLYIRFKNSVYPAECVDPLNLQVVIQNATVNDSGSYYCFLKLGDLREEQPLVCVTGVNVGYPPLPVDDFKCTSYDYFNFTCEWEPPLNAIHTVYNLTDSKSYSGTYLPVMKIRCPDHRKNSCTWTYASTPQYWRFPEIKILILNGTNSLGTRAYKYEFNHYETVIPGPFKNVTSSSTSSSINIKLKLSTDISSFPLGIFCEVQYRAELENDWNIASIGFVGYDILKVEYNLAGLHSNSNYTLAVRCRVNVTNYTWGQFTYITSKTLPFKPIEVPQVQSPSYEVNNNEYSRSITLFWKKVDPLDYNADNFSYEITYLENPEAGGKVESYSVKNIAGHVTYHVFNNMHRESTYEFQLRSRNLEGISANMSSVLVNRDSNMPQRPSDLSAVSQSSGKYKVSWSYSDDPVTDFTLFWCENLRPRPELCTGNVQSINLNSSLRSYEFTLLDEKVNYQFAVSANLGNSSSGMEWVRCVVPQGRVLDRMKPPSIMANTTGLRVSWSLDCSAQKAVITQYDIKYCKLSSANCNQRTCEKQALTKIVSGGTLEHTDLENLEPFTLYGVFISATTMAGSSEASDITCAKTSEGAPSPPRSVNGESTGNSSAIVRWEVPAIANGIVQSYVISYNGNQKIVSINGILNEYSTHLTDLESYTNYSLSIQACNQHHCSNFSSPIFVITDIGVPARMDIPYAERINSSSVKVSWKKPEPSNGPVDFYLLSVVVDKVNTTHLQNLNISGSETSQIITLGCRNDEVQSSHFLTIQAVNVNEENELFIGEPSKPKEVRCFGSAGPALAMIIGITVGGAVGLAVLVFILYIIVRWMKKRVEHMKDFEVDLPKGLKSHCVNQMSTYDNFENGSIQLGSSPKQPTKPGYDRLDSCQSYISDDGFKNRHGSGTSQNSSTSTDELLRKQNKLNEKNCRNPSGDSSGCSSAGHDSLSSSLTHPTNLSSDSGNEADLNNPPSPDIVQEEINLSVETTNNSDDSKGSSSRDSGLDDYDFKGKRSLYPYTRIPGYDSNSYVTAVPQPYSKLGIEQSFYVPVMRGRNMALFGLNMANSEPNIPEMEDEIKTKVEEKQPDDMAVMPYSKYGLSRSIQDIVGCPQMQYPVSPEIPQKKNELTNNTANLPYSRFGMRRLASPTSKTNPYITIGMSFISSPTPDPVALVQARANPLQFLSNQKGFYDDGITSKMVNKNLPGSNGYVPVEKMKVLSKNAEKSIPQTGYSVFGNANPINKAIDVSNPVQPESVKPLSSDGYVTLDDIKILAKNPELAMVKPTTLEIEPISPEIESVAPEITDASIKIDFPPMTFPSGTDGTDTACASHVPCPIAEAEPQSAQQKYCVPVQENTAHNNDCSPVSSDSIASLSSDPGRSSPLDCPSKLVPSDSVVKLAQLPIPASTNGYVSHEVVAKMNGTCSTEEPDDRIVIEMEKKPVPTLSTNVVPVKRSNGYVVIETLAGKSHGAQDV